MHNYFELLALPQSCEVDPELLEKNYRRLQASLHPDRFVNAPAPERLAALQKTGILNAAHGVLKSRLGRAEHLLQLRGIDTGQQRQDLLEPAFLQQQMDLREKLEALRENGDIDGLEVLRKQAGAGFEASWRNFVASLQAGDEQQALRHFHELQFLDKLRQEIMQAEDCLLD